MTWDGRIRADARSLPIAAESVQCIVTSPPYWGLRDYGNSDQIGLENTPDQYVESIVGVFREARRVLKPNGTAWLNLGDSYASASKGSGGASDKQLTNLGSRYSVRHFSHGLKNKDLVGIPWRVALALQSDGWYLRRDIIWHKPNPMPESVMDRPTTSHEYIFLLTKSERYYYDFQAIKEPADPKAGRDTTVSRRVTSPGSVPDSGFKNGRRFVDRNKRSVWTVSTVPFKGAHYATFPPVLIEPCILAGSRPGDLVLDPFFGSGTVGRVCEKLSHRWIGVDLGYQDLQARRVSNVQRDLLAGAAL